MSSFNDIPLVLRTLGPLAGYAELQQSLIQPQPAPAQQDNDQTAPSRKRARSPQPVSRPATPEPVQTTEPQSPPSPFIKKEPTDKNEYSAFLVQEDDDEYDPAQLVPIKSEPADRNEHSAFMIQDDDDKYDPAQRAPSAGAYSAAATMKYDPARPVHQRRQTRFSRMLSSKNGDLFEPATVCFTAPYRNDQFMHVLKCHGVIKTEKPQACGSNCETVTPGDNILSFEHGVACSHPECVEKRKKRQAACFIPNKRAKTMSVAPEDRAAEGARRSARLRKEYDDKVAKMNDRVANEPGYAYLAENLKAPGLMPKSKRHAGYAYKKELDEDAVAARLHKVTGGLDLDLDEEKNPRLKREMKKLQVDGTHKLGGMAAAFGLKRNAEAEKAAFNKHDKPVGADGDHDMPWSYANTWNAAPGQKPIRNQLAGMYSIPATTHQAMVEEENGVIMEREDTVSHRLPRNAVDLTADGDEEDGAGVFQTIERCQICEDSGDEELQECIKCHHHFHAACAAASDDSNPLDSAEENQHELIPMTCDTEGCGKPLDDIRYKCPNDACKYWHYCLGCFSKKSAEHMQKMKEMGQDLAEHYFVAVRGKNDELYNADDTSDETPFICPDCKHHERAQKMANQMLGKRPMAPKEISAQVKKEVKARNKAMAERGTFAATKKRAEEKRRSGITKTPSRRSHRLSSSGPSSGELGSSRRNTKIKLNTKTTQRLESVVEETPQDVEMGDGDASADGS